MDWFLVRKSFKSKIFLANSEGFHEIEGVSFNVNPLVNLPCGDFT